MVDKPFLLLGSTTLGSANATISLTGLAAKKYLIIEIYTLETLTLVINLQFNNDTGSNYARRVSNNGGADSTNASQTAIVLDTTSATPSFYRIFVINISANEKLVTIHHVDQNTAGAANAPSRDEIVAKWANTAAQITEVDVTTSTSTFASGTILTVYGSN